MIDDVFETSLYDAIYGSDDGIASYPLDHEGRHELRSDAHGEVYVIDTFTGHKSTHAKCHTWAAQAVMVRSLTDYLRSLNGQDCMLAGTSLH